MFVFFLEIIVAFFFCKAFMIFLSGGRPGGIFEKSEDRIFLFFGFEFFLLDSFCSPQIVLKSSRVKPSKIRVEAFFLRILITKKKKKTMNEDNTEKEAFEEDFEEEEDHDLPFISSRKATRKEEEELRLSRFFFSLSRSFLFLSFFSYRRT